ncbi:MAG: hypothetical protein ACI9BD_000030 [Candidatus Marinamargulisbacteria bacterium]|jgi:hypothetical protein
MKWTVQTKQVRRRRRKRQKAPLAPIPVIRDISREYDSFYRTTRFFISFPPYPALTKKNRSFDRQRKVINNDNFLQFY